MVGIRTCVAAGMTLAVLWGGIPTAFAAEPDAPQELVSRNEAVYINILERLSATGKKSLGLEKYDGDGLAAYYSDHRNPLLWVTADGLTERVKQLRTVIARAEEFGLNPADYPLPDAKGFGWNPDQATVWLAETELKISLAAVSYARHAQAGRFEPTLVSEFLDKHPQLPDPVVVLKTLREQDGKIPAYLESLHPQNEQFVALKKLLAQASTGSGTRVVTIPEGPSLGPGTSHPQIALLHERLGITPLAEVPGKSPADEYYDENLAEAVRAFQKRLDLGGKGVVNAATREALNREAGEDDGSGPNVNKSVIISNMERWRWEARDYGTRHVRVNIPEFMFRVVDDGNITHEERIVSGSPDHQTPIFTDEMEFVVFNPYWNVPESILVKELLPAIQRDPSFIDRNRMEAVYEGREDTDSYFFDWSYVDPRKLQLRQVPGAGNALGDVKFLFPNKHSVYMHDTPSKKLFEKPSRAFSHGCMRVRNPLKFAEVLLEPQGWSSARVRNAVGGQSDFQVPLDKKVPVHITYFTLWVGEDGKVQQFRDIYGHDTRVKVALRLERAPKAIVAEKDKDAVEDGLGN